MNPLTHDQGQLRQKLEETNNRNKNLIVKKKMKTYNVHYYDVVVAIQRTKMFSEIDR